jgi:hypothetical protein
MKRITVAALSLGLLAGPAFAHHSGAMFDRSKVVMLDGTIREFGWNNPHSWIRLVANDGSGEKEWTIEMGSSSGLARSGWTKASLKAGDHVQMKIYPLKSGGPGGTFKEVTTASGKVLGGGAAGLG